MTVRTRIAPSPTGDPHVGTAYIALFNLCFARKMGGKFVLRIEDTDRVRSTKQSEEAILSSLKWLGLDWDEGPGVGGPNGPYYQSERGEIYSEHVARLVAQGHAFPCFCTSERLNELRETQRAAKQNPRYDGHCTNVSPEEAKRRIEAGESHVVRMKIPSQGDCIVQDYVRGEISIPWEQIDMQVLQKSDGMPTYHLANVVDDHLMGITHVIRGEEWINSAPKHLKLYEYFGWEAPVFCHVGLLRNPDGSKLSKRKNPTSVDYYRRMGFLPEALLNFLGNMGWSMPDGREKFTLAEMMEAFDLDRVKAGGPVFDQTKLKALNADWIREDLSVEDFAARLAEWAVNSDYMVPLLPMIQPRVSCYSDVAPLLLHFFAGTPELSEADFQHKKFKKVDLDTCKKILQFVSWKLDQQQDWDHEVLQRELQAMANAMELKIKDFNFPIFVALSGKAVSTPLYQTLSLLGRDLSRARVRAALAVLGGVSKKQAKALDKEYRQLSAQIAAATPN